MQKIVVIGTGNLAEHLAISLFNNGLCVSQIFGRDIQKAKKIAKKVDAEAVNVFEDIQKNAYLYLLCISDSALPDVIKNIGFEPNLIVHTAGSVSVNILNKFANYGVFYPLQTFTKGRDVNMKNVPLCLEANTDANFEKLNNIANKISDKVIKINSIQRKQCHIAAVFACNFTNYFYTIAADLLAEQGMSFDIIKPLIRETAEKAISINPKKSQTGPAIRKNNDIINNHLQQLTNKDWKKLYSFVSECILKQTLSD